MQQADDIGSNLFGFFRQHPALLVSSVYVLASMIGMLFAWDFLRQFGINVFNYAQITDFLLASLKEPATWGLFFFAVLMMFMDNAMSRRWQSRERPKWLRWYGSPRYRLANWLTLLVVVGILIDAYARTQATSTKAGNGNWVVVRFEAMESGRTTMLLGTTSLFVFTYDPLTRNVDIYPHEALHSLSPAERQMD